MTGTTATGTSATTGTTGTISVMAGSGYSVSETIPSGWTLASSNCTYADDTVSLTHPDRIPFVTQGAVPTQRHDGFGLLPSPFGYYFLRGPPPRQLGLGVIGRQLAGGGSGFSMRAMPSSARP